MPNNLIIFTKPVKMKMKRLLVCLIVLVEVLMCCEGRVAKLKLQPNSNGGLWQVNYSDFIIFKDLKSLDLSSTSISDCTRADQEGLKYLEVLDLSYNDFDNATSILSCLDGLSSPKSLSLAALAFDNTSLHIFQTVLETISSKLPHLKVLDISENNLTNEILPSLRGFTSLKELYLGGIGLDSDQHIQGLFAILKNLEILDISNNNFSDTDIGSALSGLSSLKRLKLQSSEITPKSIHNISKLKSLEILDISLNNFNDTDIGSALNGLSFLKSLNLGWSQIIPKSIHNISKLRSLEILDLGVNNLNLWPTENLGFAWPSSLQVLVLGGNSLKNHGFAWPASLQVLGLRSNSFSNDIISSLNGLSRLKSLDLSGNNLKGSLNITGEYLPIAGLLTLTDLKTLDFSSNQLVNFVVPKGTKSLSRLNILALDSNMINGSNLQESLQAFPSIKNLTLTGNEFKGTTLARGFFGLNNLEYLNIGFSDNLENEFFKSIGDLPSLKVLSASNCGIKGTLSSIGDWSKLKKLEELDLSSNGFVGKLPSSFVNMTSLRNLTLTNNHFIGNIGPILASFPSLEYLNFETNQFEFPISFAQFSNHSNLNFIYGNGNKVILDSHITLKTWVPKFQLQVLQLSSITEANSIPLPNFLLYQYSLIAVDFTGCKLKGEFPNWLLENNTKMEDLSLRNCSFIGDFQLPSRHNLNLVTVDVSNNAMSGQVLSNNISSNFPNLNYLNISGNEIHGSIPHELGHIYQLDLSNNQFSGEFPRNLTMECSFLSISNNNLHGPIPSILSMYNSLMTLLLDGNHFSGSLPSNFLNSSDIENLDISNNNLVGKLPSQIQSTWLIELSMSNNHFQGSIPSELSNITTLTYLDLSQNNFSGCVPSFLSDSLSFIHLNNNKLSCLPIHMFTESSSVWILDLSDNEIKNGIHDIIFDLRYKSLNILLMKGNHFTGNIPKQLCHLTDLNILDLSYNNFSGEIPNCLGEMPFENKDPEDSRNRFNGVNYKKRYGKEKDKFTSKKRSETYTTNVLIYMSGIDLSHNQLSGSIPSELGNLTRIRSLNLSNNFFSGKIPATFSNLVQVESLDLSFNMLSGQIPPQLSGLTFLEVFSVAHNNLSGTTPERKGQFITFDESSYEGNQFLCGPPLPKSCNPIGEPATLPNGLNKDGDNDSWVDMYVFRVSFVVAYTSVLLVIAIVLFINPYWRQAWFYYIGLVSMNCFYFLKDNLCFF